MISTFKTAKDFCAFIMKTLLFTVARNIRTVTQMIAEAYLRRALLHQKANIPANYRRPFYDRHSFPGRGHRKYRKG
jgi:hypothetical protein